MREADLTRAAQQTTTNFDVSDERNVEQVATSCERCGVGMYVHESAAFRAEYEDGQILCDGCENQERDGSQWEGGMFR